MTNTLTNTTMTNLNDLNLTLLEKALVTSLISKLDAEAHFSDVETKELQDDLLIGNINIVKGIIGSLCKKGIIFVGEDDFEGIIYLSSEYHYLHPEWSKD